MIKRVDTKTLFQSKLNDVQQANSTKNIAEGDAGVTEMTSYPRRMVIELTNRCNLNCIMCGRTGRHFKHTNFNDKWFSVLEEAFDHTEEVVLHGWGEPLLYPGFTDLLAYLDRFPVRKYFCTNGMLLDKYMGTIFEQHVDILAISMDGASQETNDYIREGGKQDRILDNIRAMVKYKEDNGLDYPHMNFVFTAMSNNIHELPDMVNLAESVGLTEVKVVYLTAFDDELATLSLFNQQETVKKHFAEAESRAEEKGIMLKLPYIQGEDPNGDAIHKQCFFPFRDLFVGSDGFVRPCMSNTQRLVNIEEVNCFNDIWNHDNMKVLRRDLTDECLTCYHSSCANWNRKSSFIHFDDVLLPDWES